MKSYVQQGALSSDWSVLVYVPERYTRYATFLKGDFDLKTQYHLCHNFLRTISQPKGKEKLSQTMLLPSFLHITVWQLSWSSPALFHLLSPNKSFECLVPPWCLLLERPKLKYMLQIVVWNKEAVFWDHLLITCWVNKMMFRVLFMAQISSINPIVKDFTGGGLENCYK